MSEIVDWRLAAATGARLAPRGPELPRVEARAAVEELREHAARAVPLVAEVSGLHVPGQPRFRVVDRPAWIAANVASMRLALGPLLERLEDKQPPAMVRDVGAAGTALEMGAVLAWMSGKVLGQYDLFGERRELLLVAPTIVHVERSLGVDPNHFRLWVCLHEETHRAQFGAHPWLREHLLGLIAEFVDVSELSAREWLGALTRAIDALASRHGSVVEALQTPSQREVFARITAFMSLLEGHADVVMDRVGPQVVPSVADIRARFTQRREQPSGLDALARRALGMDAKLRQYSEGAHFVRAVIDARGMDGFNAVWESARTLPTLDEIRTPRRWLARVPR